MPQSHSPLRGLGGGSAASVRLIARAVRQQFGVPDRIRRRLSKVLGDVLADSEAATPVRLKACDTVARMIQADQTSTLRLVQIQMDAESIERDRPKAPPEASPAPPKRERTDEEKQAAIRATLKNWTGMPDVAQPAH